MTRNEVFAGLDIGTTKVCCVAAECGDDGQILITGVGLSPSTGLKRGVVVDIEATTHAVEDAVARASQQCGRAITSLYVGVTGEHIKSMNSKGVTAITHPDREITEEDRDRAHQQSRVIVIPPDRVILHAIPRSYSIDGQNGIRQPVGMTGTRLEVETHIVTGAHTFLDNVRKCVSRAGLNLIEMVLEPIAAGEAVVTEQEKDLGVCLVDIGGGTTDLAIFQEGNIYHSAVIPVGGNHVTNDLAQLLRVTTDEAEKLKISYGCAVSEGVGANDTVPVVQIGRTEPRPMKHRGLCEIVEARMQELFQLVQKEIARAGCTGTISAGVVLTGGGSQLSGTLDCARDILRMPVRLGRPTGVLGLADVVHSPVFATGVGLVQYGVRSQRRAHPLDAGTGKAWGAARHGIGKLLGKFRTH